jgi:DNA-3-methyladenine glycosylase I
MPTTPIALEVCGSRKRPEVGAIRSWLSSFISRTYALNLALISAGRWELSSVKAMLDTRQSIIMLPDGKPRCGWVGAKGREWLSYHDDEWGTPTRNQVSLFEALSLTIFEGGLSWETVFRRRAEFRRAFHGFEPERVAAMTSRDVDALLADRAIIRNRRKVEATVQNARRAAVGPPLPGLVWAHAKPGGQGGTPEAARLASVLKQEGYALVGPVVAHSFMQSVGIVNGHFAGCFRAPRAPAARAS